MTVDSLCVTTWRARPVSFVSLMTLYESNYIRLRGLVGDVRGLSGRHISLAPADCDLHLEVLGHSPYTSILRLTYLFDDPAGLIAEPDLEVRVYHDARLAEASRCARWIRHPGLETIRSQLSLSLGDEELRSLLARDGRTPVPPFLSAQYNPPWTIPPFRRNEIIVRFR